MISALFDRLFLLLIRGKLRKACNGLSLRSSEFAYEQLNNIVYLYEYTLSSLDLINKYKTKEKIKISEITHVTASKSPCLCEPYGFLHTLNNPTTKINAYCKELDSPDFAKNQWIRFLTDFQRRFLSKNEDLPDFYKFDFAKKLIWSNKDFSHRIFYLHYLSKRYGWDYTFDASIVRFGFDTNKLKDFLALAHPLMLLDAYENIKDLEKKYWFSASSFFNFKSYAYNRGIFPDIKDYSNRSLILLETPYSDPLYNMLHKHGILDFNDFVKYIYDKCDSKIK